MTAVGTACLLGVLFISCFFCCCAPKPRSKKVLVGTTVRLVFVFLVEASRAAAAARTARRTSPPHARQLKKTRPSPTHTNQAQDGQFIAANSPPPTQDIATHGDQYSTGAAAYPVKGAAAV